MSILFYNNKLYKVLTHNHKASISILFKIKGKSRIKLLKWKIILYMNHMKGSD